MTSFFLLTRLIQNGALNRKPWVGLIRLVFLGVRDVGMTIYPDSRCGGDDTNVQIMIDDEPYDY